MQHFSFDVLRMISILLIILNFSVTRASSQTDLYQVTSWINSIGPTSTMNDNSYSEITYFSDLPLLIGASQLTIGTWLKFDTRSTTDVAYIPIFYLWSGSNSAWLHKLSKYYQSSSPTDQCLSTFSNAGTTYQQFYNRTQTPRCGFQRNYWYHITTTMNFTSATSFQGQLIFYDPTVNAAYQSQTLITWSGGSSLGTYVFQAADYISLRHSGDNDYPAIDAIFTATYITPHYLAGTSSTFAFGPQEANYLLIYQFNNNTETMTVTDLSGNGYNGTLNQPLSAVNTFSASDQIIIPNSNNFCSYLQPLTSKEVVGLFINLNILSIPASSKAIILTIKTGSTVYFQLYANYNSSSQYDIRILDSTSATQRFGFGYFSYNTVLQAYFLFRTYSDSLNSGIDASLYLRNMGLSAPLRLGTSSSSTFAPTTCSLILGDTSSGVTGYITDFRILYGTGAIPGIHKGNDGASSGWPVIEEDCYPSLGLIKGNNYPCQASCSDQNCIACENSVAFCTACAPGYQYFYPHSSPPSCVISCPTGWVSNQSNVCINCNATGTFAYENTCVSDCPSGLIKDNTTAICARCPNPQYFFNHTCVNSCPNKTFSNTTVYECQACFFGCDTCTDSQNSSCTYCSEGYFFNTGYCLSGCSPSEFENSDIRTCQPCQPPCDTCSQPDNLHCTDCPQDYLLLNGQCLLNCSSDYYEGYVGNYSSYKVPACLPKLTLEFSLALTAQARVIYLSFNYSITDILIAIVQLIQVQIANVQIDPTLYTISPLSDSKLQFQYLGDQYYPSLALLNVTIDLDSSVNNDPYQVYRSGNKSAYLQLKEIYPFTQTQVTVISSVSNTTQNTGTALSTAQAASAIASGGVSLNLIRLQIIGEIVQLQRLINIAWPPSVQSLFASTKYDPNSITIQFDLTGPFNRNLQNRNTSMPRIFQEYGIGPFFTENYNNELSNIFVLGVAVIVGSIILKFLKSKLQSITARLRIPKTNANMKFRDRCVRFIHRMSRLLNRVESAQLCNFLLFFVLTIFQSGALWSLVNIRFSHTLLEPPTSYTNGALGIAITCLMVCLSLVIFSFYAVLSNLKFLLHNPESLWPVHTKPYRNLFDDFNNKNRWQLLFVPFTLLRSLAYVIILVFMDFSPMAQMIATWVVTLIFIVYMIVLQPLKDKWTRRITLVIESFAFGGMTIGFVTSSITLAIGLEPTTLDEIGFTFIAFSMVSTLGGGLLTLIQLVSLIISIFKYFRKLHLSRHQVKPVALEDFYASRAKKQDSATPTEITNAKLKTEPNNQSNKIEKAFHYFGNLPLESISQSPEGKQLLEGIQKWVNENHPSSAEIESREMIRTPEEGRRKNFEGRISLFTDN